MPPHTMVALKLHSSNTTKRKIFFGAWYFPCFFVKVTVPPMGGGDCKWGITRGGGGGIHIP